MTNQVSVPAAPRSAAQADNCWTFDSYLMRETFELAVSCGNLYSSRIQSGEVLISLFFTRLGSDDQI